MQSVDQCRQWDAGCNLSRDLRGELRPVFQALSYKPSRDSEGGNTMFTARIWSQRRHYTNIEQHQKPHTHRHTFNCPRGGIKLRASLHIPTFSHQWLSGNLNIHHQNQTIRPLCLRTHRSVEIHMLVKMVQTAGLFPQTEKGVNDNPKELLVSFKYFISIVWSHSAVKGNVRIATSLWNSLKRLNLQNAIQM